METIESSGDHSTSELLIDHIRRPKIPSAVNLTFRKDSLDVPQGLKLPPSPWTLSHQVTTNLDAPRVHVTSTKGTVYKGTSSLDGDGATEV